MSAVTAWSNQNCTVPVSSRPNPGDVLLGRGTQINKHEGNIRFRKIVESRKAEYTSCDQNYEKDLIARQVGAAVVKQGGRFLRRATQGESTWEVVDEKTALLKVKQAFRDNTRNSNVALRKEAAKASGSSSVEASDDVNLSDKKRSMTGNEDIASGSRKEKVPRYGRLADIDSSGRSLDAAPTDLQSASRKDSASSRSDSKGSSRAQPRSESELASVLASYADRFTPTATSGASLPLMMQEHLTSQSARDTDHALALMNQQRSGIRIPQGETGRNHHLAAPSLSSSLASQALHSLQSPSREAALLDLQMAQIRARRQRLEQLALLQSPQENRLESLLRDQLREQRSMASISLPLDSLLSPRLADPLLNLRGRRTEMHSQLPPSFNLGRAISTSSNEADVHSGALSQLLGRSRLSLDEQAASAMARNQLKGSSLQHAHCKAKFDSKPPPK